MNGKWLSVVALIGIAAALMIQPSCARSQKLIGIQIQPSAYTFLTADPALVANFTAIGTYIHPPATKDITSQVTWGSDASTSVTIANGAVSPTGNECGVVNISASYSKGTQNGSVVIGYATVTIDGPSPCPQ